MWDTYKEYCSFMESKGYTPVSEEIFNRDYRRKSEEEKAAEQIEHIPFIARQSATGKCIEPSLHNHERPKKLSKSPVRVNLLDIPKIEEEEEEIKRSDFVNTDDYYDALEAQKMVSIMREVNSGRS